MGAAEPLYAGENFPNVSRRKVVIDHAADVLGITQPCLEVM